MAGAATVAPRMCKVGCDRPARGRGMCINCYEKWRRINKHVIGNQLEKNAVIDMLPARVKEIRETMGMGFFGVSKLLEQLYEDKRAHIGSYDPPSASGCRFAPVWVAGPGKHAKEPTKEMRDEHRRLAQRNSYARRRQQSAGWAGVLGVAL